MQLALLKHRVIARTLTTHRQPRLNLHLWQSINPYSGFSNRSRGPKT